MTLDLTAEQIEADAAHNGQTPRAYFAFACEAILRDSMKRDRISIRHFSISEPDEMERCQASIPDLCVRRVWSGGGYRCDNCHLPACGFHSHVTPQGKRWCNACERALYETTLMNQSEANRIALLSASSVTLREYRAYMASTQEVC